MARYTNRQRSRGVRGNLLLIYTEEMWPGTASCHNDPFLCFHAIDLPSYLSFHYPHLVKCEFHLLKMPPSFSFRAFHLCLTGFLSWTTGSNSTGHTVSLWNKNIWSCSISATQARMTTQKGNVNLTLMYLLGFGLSFSWFFFHSLGSFTCFHSLGSFFSLSATCLLSVRGVYLGRSGKGYSPLISDHMWFVLPEHLYLWLFIGSSAQWLHTFHRLRYNHHERQEISQNVYLIYSSS